MTIVSLQNKQLQSAGFRGNKVSVNVIKVNVRLLSVYHNDDWCKLAVIPLPVYVTIKSLSWLSIQKQKQSKIDK